jgi:hypothetical protein
MDSLALCRIKQVRTDMAQQVYSTQITFEITSKGRKYFKIRYSPHHSEFQLLINEISKDFQVGDRVEDLLCEFETKSSGYGQKTTAIPVNAETLEVRRIAQAEVEKQQQIQRWRGYLEEHLDTGEVYQRAITELKALGFDVLSVYKDRISVAQEQHRQSEVVRWSGYCEAAALEGRDYQKGYAKLRELGAGDRIDSYQHQASGVRIAEQNRKSQEAQEQRQEETANGIIDYWFGSPAWVRSEERTDLQVGDFYQEKDGNWYRILTRTRRYVREDGLSFGLADDQGEIVTGKARLATAEEATPLMAALEREQSARAEKRRQANERKELARIITTSEKGLTPEHHVGEMLLSTVDLYGGGDWFEIDETEHLIWYCRNNGRDGDNWGHNNVTTWGAGAIGRCIPYDQEIAQRIRALVTSCDPDAVYLEREVQSLTHPTEELTPQVPTVDHQAIAEQISELINASDDYSATLWSKAENQTRVYVQTTCRRRKDCGYVLVNAQGEIERHLSRQGGTIAGLYGSVKVGSGIFEDLKRSS